MAWAFGGSLRLAGDQHARGRVSVAPPSPIGVVPAHSGASPPSRTFRLPPSPSRLFPAPPARPGGKRDDYDREVPQKISFDVPPPPLRRLPSGRFPQGNPESGESPGGRKRRPVRAGSPGAIRKGYKLGRGSLPRRSSARDPDGRGGLPATTVTRF